MIKTKAGSYVLKQNASRCMYLTTKQMMILYHLGLHFHLIQSHLNPLVAWLLPLSYSPDITSYISYVGKLPTLKTQSFNQPLSKGLPKISYGFNYYFLMGNC